MDFDLFFSAPRWKILHILANKPSSPVEISEKIQTSVAYVSQQLKLLETANLIVKTKTGSVEKGKPRNLYSLTNELVQCNVLMHGLPARKLVHLSDYHKVILRIWLLENQELHYYVEKLYWMLENDLSIIEGIFVEVSLSTRILVVSDQKKLKQMIKSYLGEIDNKISCSLVSRAEFANHTSENLHTIYDPKQIFNWEDLKGGKQDE